MATLCDQVPDWVIFEHQVHEILHKQEQHGFHFDTNAARQLASSLDKELREIERSLQRQHPFVDGGEFTPKRNNSSKGYEAGSSFTRLIETNFGSRDHIVWILKTHYGWEPQFLTDTGKAKMDETVLSKLDLPIAQKLTRVMMIRKMLGMISTGANAWLRLCTNDRIHHHCSITTVTHRASHRYPNVAQTPSDSEYRALFTASPYLCLVGADLSAIELRMLAHLISRYSTDYREKLLGDDIHQVNADKIGVTRSQVKTIQYAMLYGASDMKIGTSYDPKLSKAQAAKKGKELRKAFVDAIPGLDKVLSAVQKAAEKGTIKSLDGRQIIVDSPHKALNSYLQSSAGIIAKRWMLLANNAIKEANLTAHQIAFIHDELQFECKPEHSKDLRFILEWSAVESGEFYKLRCPIAADSKCGRKWSETH